MRRLIRIYGLGLTAFLLCGASTAYGQADLSITKTDGVTSVLNGDTVTYTVVARNAGPQAHPNVQILDFVAPDFSSFTWTCVGAGGANCPSLSVQATSRYSAA